MVKKNISKVIYLFPEQQKEISIARAYNEFVDTWNKMAKENNLPTGWYWESLSEGSKFKRMFKARWKEPVFREKYKEAIDLIPESDFLLGQNNHGWRANIEWFLRPDTIQKILNNFYSGRERRFGYEAEGFERKDYTE